MKANIRYIKPSGTARRAGTRAIHRKPKMYRGYEIRGSGAGFHHVYYMGQEIATGFRNITAAKEEIDRLAPLSEALHLEALGQ
jgi:hypothetical protein